MTDIEKEEFAFSIYNQLVDEFGLIDRGGVLAHQIQTSKGQKLDQIISSLKNELLSKMKENVLLTASKLYEDSLVSALTEQMNS